MWSPNRKHRSRLTPKKSATSRAPQGPGTRRASSEWRTSAKKPPRRTLCCNGPAEPRRSSSKVENESSHVRCLVSALSMLAARAPKLQADGTKEVTSPNANKQSGAEQDHSIYAGQVPPGPIDTLLDVQPERKLVQGESSAHTVEQGHQTARQEGGRAGPRPHFDEPAKAHR